MIVLRAALEATRLQPRDTRATLARIVANSKRMPNGCREWQGPKDVRGYGRMGIVCADGSKCTRSPHIVAFEAVRGPVPSGLELDHVVCDNPKCCDEWHVEPATHRDNTLRSASNPTAQNARKTHCKRGHEFTPENTYSHIRRSNGLPMRRCRICGYEGLKARRNRLRLVPDPGVVSNPDPQTEAS